MRRILHWTHYLLKGAFLWPQIKNTQLILPFTENVYPYFQLRQKWGSTLYNNALFEAALWKNKWNGYGWKTLHWLVTTYFKYLTLRCRYCVQGNIRLAINDKQGYFTPAVAIFKLNTVWHCTVILLLYLLTDWILF